MSTSSQDSNSRKGLEEKDVGAIGKHCDLPYCHRLDFLPFVCESCKGTFCLDHRSETAHKCINEGQWASARNKEKAPSAAPSHQQQPKPRNLLEAKCAHPKCRTVINTTRDPGVNCQQCRRQYCLSHRLQDSHDCDKVKPAEKSSVAAEKARSALDKFKAWTSSTSGAIAEKRTAVKPDGRQILELAKLRRNAKGDEKIPVEKRVYVHVEAEAKSTTSKLPSGDYYYSKDWSIGRVLDKAALDLQVANFNNRGDSEEKKLRVFHIEAGRVLSFGEKLGDCVASGNTLVLLRGLQLPELLET
ncbi:hypothetical protein RUND412_001138 [Rhizina undulata]